MSVAVVICAYTEDRWALLVRAVESVQAQTVVPDALVLCIDHNDALAERARRQWPAEGQQRLPHVRVVQNRFEGRLGSSRNTGVELVDADVVAFLDDDAAAAPDWLEQLLRTYEETGAVAVGGAPRPEYERPRPDWFPDEFNWVFGCHYTGLPETRAPVRHLIGASMSVRTAALKAIGGFKSDNHDDMDLSHRIAAAHGPESVLYEPRAAVHHFVGAERVTWAYFRRRCYQVNRGKVRAFADMGEAGTLDAELAFARRMAGTVLRRLGRGVAGDRPALSQAAAIVAGLGLAGAGHLHGKLDLRRGRTPDPLTRGLPA